MYSANSIFASFPRKRNPETQENSELLEISYKTLRQVMHQSDAARVVLSEAVKSRSVPIRLQQPVVFPHQNVTGDDFIILKNDVEHLKMRFLISHLEV